MRADDRLQRMRIDRFLAWAPAVLAEVRGLLIVDLDFADNINIRPIGLDHEKFAHSRWLKDNVGDVEIVGNHHQI
jgi:hypothetical protein